MTYDGTDDGGTCHFCGAQLDRHSYEHTKDGRQRHYLSDCRPDLVAHEPGELCTWAYVLDPKHPGYDPKAHSCYAFQDGKTWTDSHSHFYPDGPMT